MYCIWSWNRPLNSALVTALFVITPVFMLNSGYIWNKTETKQFHWNKTVFCVCFVSVTFQYYFSSNHGFTRDAILNLTSRAAFISLRLLSSYQWCLSWRNLKNVADERLFFSHVPYTEKRTHIRCKLIRIFRWVHFVGHCYCEPLKCATYPKFSSCCSHVIVFDPVVVITLTIRGRHPSPNFRLLSVNALSSVAQ